MVVRLSLFTVLFRVFPPLCLTFLCVVCVLCCIGNVACSKSSFVHSFANMPGSKTPKPVNGNGYIKTDRISHDTYVLSSGRCCDHQPCLGHRKIIQAAANHQSADAASSPHVPSESPAISNTMKYRNYCQPSGRQHLGGHHPKLQYHKDH